MYSIIIIIMITIIAYLQWFFWEIEIYRGIIMGHYSLITEPNKKEQNL